MKKLVFTLLTISIIGCQSNIQNDANKLNEILSMDKMELEVVYSSSVGGYEYHYDLRKSELGYSIKSLETGKSKKLNNQELNDFKNFLSTRIGQSNPRGCTDEFYLILGTKRKSINISSSCGSFDDFSKVIKLMNLTSINPK